MTIPVLGRDEKSNNPLLILSDAVAHQTSVLEKIAKAMPAKHVYQLHSAGPEQWLVYCNGCSEAEERYVWPCHVREHDAPVPPSGFTAEMPAGATSD